MKQDFCLVRITLVVVLLMTFSVLVAPIYAVPEGYRKTTIELNSPPVGLLFDMSGVLYAMEGATFGTNTAMIRVIHPDGSFGTNLPIVGDDEDNFFIGSMTYDPLADGLLITDNTADGRIYSLSKAGSKQLVASGIPAIAGIAVRGSGEVFVSTALGDNLGQVLQIDRTSGTATPVVSGLDFGAGLAFDAAGDLFIQDADATTFAGRIQRLPIDDTGGTLSFGSLVPLIDGMQSSAGIAFDSEGDLFSTGSGGLFTLSGMPLAEVLFDSNGDPFQFATAIAFSPGTAPFEPFAGPDGGRLALMSNFGFNNQDTFITVIEPLSAPNADFNGDSLVDVMDLGTWQTNYGLADSAILAQGDADGDQDVDGKDFLIWQRQYLASNELAAPLAIPEPNTLLLAGLFILALRTRGKLTS